MSSTWLARAVVVLWCAAFVQSQNVPDPTLKSWDSPKYPPLARQARIQGKVQLEFWVNHNGDVVSVNVLSGHPMLAPAASENVKSWKFQLPKSASSDDRRYETAFDFELLTEDIGLPVGTNSRVVINSFREVHVIAAPVGLIQRSHCPSEQEKRPPSRHAASDFVEMSRSECYGSCPAYMVRIHADGAIDWEGRSYVVVGGKDSASIGPRLAQDLISKFSSADFWALCESYSQSITDSATTDFRVSIGGKTKTVANYANSAPAWLADLEYAVDETVDTHRWLHGDPRNEPLSRISNDRYGPKPGLTALMRAAGRADAKKVKQLLKDGLEPNEADSSGWTALMYANTRVCGDGSCSKDEDVVRVLLAAGADPKHSSPRGDTPLMAAAYDGHFESAFTQAGADINGQNSDGVSALMILASLAEADEIRRSLQAGADPKLKDAQGRTALNYLQLASCGQSPLRDEALETKVEYGECNALDKDDVNNSRKLLMPTMDGEKP